MTITLANLPEELVRFIQAQTEQGGYPSAEEYVKALLRREAAAVISSSRIPSAPQQTESLQQMRERELAVQKQLVRAGLLAEVKLPPPAPQGEDFKPVPIQGPPLSETVIQDRR
jgi:Arc/MetJ-type ribon-helix-helix transcriptional regulator